MKNKIVNIILPIFYVFIVACAITSFYHINKNIHRSEDSEVIYSNLELSYGQTYQIDLDFKKQQKKNIKLESSNSELVSVDKNGLLSVNSNQDGQVVITITTEKKKILASISIKVSKIENIINVTGITLDKNEINLKYGDSSKINILFNPENATNKVATWTSSDPNLVSIDNNGNIKAIQNKDGECMVTAETADGSYTASAKVKVTYVDQTIKVEAVKLNRNLITLQYGNTEKLIATISPSNATNKNLVWTSSNPSLVEIDNLGNIITKTNQDGEAIITVRTIDGEYTDNITVKVEAIDKVIKATGVKVSKNAVSLKYGEKTKITATILPSNATNKAVTWTSSDPKLVSIDNNGNIKAVGNKDATTKITVKTADGGYTKTIKVTVASIKVSGVELNKSSLTLRYGKTTNLTANILPSNAANKAIVWTSSNPRIATVNDNGTITAVDKGKAIITATTKDGNYTANCTVTVERKSYTVQFNSDGGTTIENQNILEGVKATEPSIPKKDGYIFDGWLLNNSKYNFNTNVTSNIILTANWKTDYNAVDYCPNMPISYKKDGVILKNCIKDFVMPTQKNKIMQTFSITPKYIYFSSPLNGAWLSNYSSSDLKNTSKYNEIVDSSDFESKSSVFITRIDKSNGNYKVNKINYSGHGQGFDTIPGTIDSIYITTIAHPVDSSSLNRVGAASSGISYTTFKEDGDTRVPGVTIAFNSKGAAIDRIVSTNYLKNGKFDSVAYFKTIKNYSKNSSMMKNITSMAIDEKNDKLAYYAAGNIYIYSLQQVKNGTANSYINKFKSLSNQGIELDGNFLYVITNTGNTIGLHKYNIETGKEIKTVNMDLSNLYKGRIENGKVIEAEGMSIYNGKLYIGIVSRETGGAGYNDIYLVDGF